MPVATVTVDSSQFPDAVRAALLDSLRNRKVNHKFLYDSYKQTQKWLELHDAFSPARTDTRTEAAYEQAFDEVSRDCHASQVRVIGLGCGGGQKDRQLLLQLAAANRRLSYTALDVSPAMVLVARKTVMAILPETQISMAVCDLASAQNLLQTLQAAGVSAEAPEFRLFTFFGMMPNFEPLEILPRLATLVGGADGLLLSANLAPGPNYSLGVQKILPQYDNSLTREWLWLFLSDLGFEAGDGMFEFGIEPDDSQLGLLRVVGWFRLRENRVIRIGSESFAFNRGDAIRLFFSYRHTPEILEALLKPFGLRIAKGWISPSGEEGVFSIARSAPSAQGINERQ